MTLTLPPDVSTGPAEERLYGISELAGDLGITARAIRFYEAKGLLTPPRANGGRVYTRRERARLKLYLARQIDRLLARGSEAVPRSVRHSRAKGGPSRWPSWPSAPMRSSRSWSRSRPMWRRRSRNSRTSAASASAISPRTARPSQRSLARGERGPKRSRRSQSKD